MTNLSKREYNTMVALHLLEALCMLIQLFMSKHYGIWYAAPALILPFISLAQPSALAIMTTVRMTKHRDAARLYVGRVWYEASMDLLQSLRDAVAVLCLLAILLQMTLHFPNVTPVMYVFLILPVVSSLRLLILAMHVGIERGYFKWK